MTEDEAPNLNEVLETAQRVQREIQRIQQDLGSRTVEGSAGGGMVKAQVNGRQQLVSVAIDPEIVDRSDVAMLQDLVVAAVNQGLVKAAELAQEEISKVTGGLPIKIPGLT